MKASLGSWDTVPRTEAVRMFFHAEGHFSIEIPAWPGKLLTIRELHIVTEVTIFLKVSNLQTK